MMDKTEAIETLLEALRDVQRQLDGYRELSKSQRDHLKDAADEIRDLKAQLKVGMIASAGKPNGSEA